jgi:hypothetical protein
MRAEDGAALRDAWKAKGSPSCNHPLLAIETTATGYLTGSYICKICGHTVKIPVAPPS